MEAVSNTRVSSSDAVDVAVAESSSSASLEAVALAVVMVVRVCLVLVSSAAAAVLETPSEVPEAVDDAMGEVKAPFAGASGRLEAVVVVDGELVVVLDIKDGEGVVMAAGVADGVTSELVSSDEVVSGMTTDEAMKILFTASAEAVDVSAVVVVGSEDAWLCASVVDAGVVISAEVWTGCVVMANVEYVVEVLVEVEVEVEVTAVARMFHAAAAAPSISSSETGFSSSLQPVCMGVRRSESTLERPSGHSGSIHSSTISRRPSLEATHMSFWLSSLSVLYPACWMQS